MYSEKFRFAQQLMESCTNMIRAGLSGIDSREVYNDREYFPEGNDPITDEDIAELEITVLDIEHAMQFFENFQKMLDNLQVEVADYRKTLNLMRTDK